MKHVTSDLEIQEETREKTGVMGPTLSALFIMSLLGGGYFLLSKDVSNLAKEQQITFVEKKNISPEGKMIFAIEKKVFDNLGVASENKVRLEATENVVRLIESNVADAVASLQTDAGKKALEKAGKGYVLPAVNLLGEMGQKDKANRSLYYQQQGALMATVDTDQSLKFYEKAARSDSHLANLFHYGNLALYVGKTKQAKTAFEQLKQKASAANNAHYKALSSQSLSSLLREKGDLSTAEELLKNNLKIQQKNNQKMALADTHNNLGVLYQKRKQFQKAKDHFNQALTTYRGTKMKKAEAHCLGNLGVIAWHEKEFKKAEAFFNQAIQIDVGLGNLAPLSRYYNYLGRIALVNKKVNSARISFLKAVDVDQKINDQQALARDYMQLGALEMREKLYDLAETYYQKANDLLSLQKQPQALAKLLGNMGLLYGLKGETERAVYFHKNSGELARRTKMKDVEATSYANLGLLNMSQGAKRDACSNWQQAQQLFTKVNMAGQQKRLAKWLKESGCQIIN